MTTAPDQTPTTVRVSALEALIDDSGLTFAEAIAAFSARQTDDDARFFIALAREELERAGSIEIDDNTITAGSSDHGDYVLAWVWVSDPRPEPGDDEDEDEDHGDGDGCAIYDTGYQVHWNGDLSVTKDVEDLAVGETYNDPANDAESTWWPVSAVVTVDDQVHVEADADDD